MATAWRKRPEIDGDRLGEDYARGTSLRALATAYGLSYGTVHRRLSEAGVQLRDRGGWHRPAEQRS